VRTDAEFDGALRVMAILTGVHSRFLVASERADTGVPMVR
jgi:hypothetical protein